MGRSMQSDEFLTIRAMCETFGVTARTLRFYEARELLAPVREGARRLYTRRDRARLRLILRGKRFGFSLEDIRQILNLYDRDGTNLAQMERTWDLAQERLREMERQRDELEIAIAELKSELAHGQDVIAAARLAAAS